MECSFDVFLTCLPRDVNETVIRNLFKTVGNVTKVKIIDDKKNENLKLSFVGFGSMDEAMEAVRLADRSTAFGEPIKASISRKCLENYDSQKPSKPNNDFNKSNFNNVDENSSTNGSHVGRGRGSQPKRESLPPSFISKSVNLTDIKLKSKELIDVEIVDLSNLECICARPLKHTENSKVEITDLLTKINSSSANLKSPESPKIGDCYLGKWDDDAYYRAELLDILSDGKFKVTFVDEGTSGDIVTDLMLIPEGSLQQYPKQFTRISLGCHNSDDLRSFIINESDGKKVSLYWLGNVRNGIPLINLFLGDEEIVEKFILMNRNYIRESFALKFKDMPNHKSETICHSVTLLQSMYKSQSEFTVQVSEPVMINCEKKTPFILPVPGDLCIYEKRSGANNVSFLRCVIKRRQLFSFDILLFDFGESLTNVSIDCLYAAEDHHKVSPPCSIICENDKGLGYDEETFNKVISDSKVKFTICSYKGNNRYLVSAVVDKRSYSRYPDVVMKRFVSKKNKVLVTHVVSLLNFFAQVDEPECIQALNVIHEKLNINYKGSKFNSLDSITVGQAVVAPFSIDEGSGENFRATVLELRKQAPHVHVFYIDYGNDGWVDFKQLLDIDDDIVKRAGLAINCTLNIDIRKEAWNHALELFSKLSGFTDNDCCDLIMESFGEREGKLVVDLTSEVKGSISMALEKSGTCTKKSNNSSEKPMCNGDSSRSPPSDKSHSTIRSSDVKQNDIKKSSQLHINNEDFGYLLGRMNELDQRLLTLEKKFA